MLALMIVVARAAIEPRQRVRHVAARVEIEPRFEREQDRGRARHLLALERVIALLGRPGGDAQRADQFLVEQLHQRRRRRPRRCARPGRSGDRSRTGSRPERGGVGGHQLLLVPGVDLVLQERLRRFVRRDLARSCWRYCCVSRVVIASRLRRDRRPALGDIGCACRCSAWSMRRARTACCWSRRARSTLSAAVRPSVLFDEKANIASTASGVIDERVRRAWRYRPTACRRGWS